MDAIAKQLLDDLLTTPGTSGYEQRVQRVVHDYLKPIADETRFDTHGNLIAVKNPGRDRKILLDAHCDQIGLIVSYIDEQGFLFVQPIGGWDAQQLVGQKVVVWANDEGVPGVVSRKPIHLQDDKERGQVAKLQDLWIDIGASSFEEASEMVRVGDSVTLSLGYQTLANRRIAGPAMDDRTGLWLALEAFRAAAASDPSCSLYVVSAVQEEIGLRGARTAAYSVDPDIGIALEVTHATDCPGLRAHQQGDLKVGEGPVLFRGPNMNPRVFDALEAAAKAVDADYQLAACGRAAPNDSNAIQTNRGGVATALISLPNRYMHSGVEMVSLDDMENGVKLLAEYLIQAKPDDVLIP